MVVLWVMINELLFMNKLKQGFSPPLNYVNLVVLKVVLHHVTCICPSRGMPGGAMPSGVKAIG